MATLEDLSRSLDLPALRGGKLKDYVTAGVAKIQHFQQPDGQFSLWCNGSDVGPFYTAFGLYGLLASRRAGYDVSQDVIDRGLSALETSVQQGASMQNDVDVPMGEKGADAFVLYVLSEYGKPDVQAMEKAYSGRDGMPVFGQALLARAMHEAGQSPAEVSTLETSVLTHLQPVDSGAATTPFADAANIVDSDEGEMGAYMSSGPRTTAMALQMLLEVDPSNAAIPRLVHGLLASRSDGRWDDTQENFFALDAIARYARAQAGPASPRVTFAMGSTVLSDGVLGSSATGGGGADGNGDNDTGGGRLDAVGRLDVPMDNLVPGALTLTPSGGTVYYSARIRYDQPLDTTAPADDAGFTVARRYVDADSGTALGTNLAQGQVVRVVLDIDVPAHRDFVALTDRLPAGLEPVDPKLVTSGADGEGAAGEGPWNAVEMHDDRVAAFADSLEPGQYEYSYLARATTPGTFVLPPAGAQEMYQTSVEGRTAAGTVTIK
jgi:uncharacterized protein YfaS (alpha-2-macroglobulin family)